MSGRRLPAWKQTSLGGLGLEDSWTLALHRKQRNKTKAEEKKIIVQKTRLGFIGSELRRHFEIQCPHTHQHTHTQFDYAEMLLTYRFFFIKPFFLVLCFIHHTFLATYTQNR